MTQNTTTTPSKTKCAISRAQFNEHAVPMVCTFGGSEFVAEPKQMGTGSMGWGINAQMTVMLDGVAVKVQVGVNLTVVKSKDLPE